jgi:glycosyltransferase involved in cell wall biosynthesis
VRILIISGSLPPAPCGVGDYTDRLATALSKIPGFSVAVMTAGEASGSGAAYEVLRIPDWRLTSAAAAMRILRGWRPDVVHLQHPTLGYAGGMLPSLLILLAWISGAKIIRTWHEAFLRSQLREFALQISAPGPYIVVRPDFEKRLWRPLRPFLKGRRRIFMPGASAIPRSTLSEAERKDLRADLLGTSHRLIAFFGFLYPEKGVEQIFDVANPVTDKVVIVGEKNLDQRYTQFVEEQATRSGVAVSFLGFLAPAATADVLAAADVVLLPFRTGAGVWNSSVRAAVLQGTPVVTTSKDMSGFDREQGIQYVPPGDIGAMRSAVAALAGSTTPVHEGDEWTSIAALHGEAYQSLDRRNAR